MTVFDGEDVILEEDILKKTRDYVPSFLEWASDGNVEQVIKSFNRESAGTTIGYTVPNNFTLFITNMHLSSEVIVAAPGVVQVSVKVRDDIVLAHLHNIGQGDHATSSFNFPMPVRVDSGDTVSIITASSALKGSAQFVGFLLPKKISIR